MKFLELNHVAIHVRNVERSCDFYRRVLKLEPIPRPDFDFPGAWFRLGERQELHLIGRSKEADATLNPNNHFALLVDDMDPWEHHFQENSFTHLPRRIRPDGAYQINLTDPDGHYIELCTVPGIASP